MAELLPCRVCGSNAEIVSFQTFSWCDVYHRVRCQNENCEEQTSRCESVSDAVNEWNTRTQKERGADNG